MHTRRITLALLIVFGFSSPSFVEAVIFEFGDLNGGGQAATDLDGKSTGFTTSGSIVLTSTASSGVFNSSDTLGFGINAEFSGDNTTQFDDGSVDGAEFMTFSFNVPVVFESIFLTAFGNGTDVAFLTIPGPSSIDIDQNVFAFPTGLTLAANTTASFGFKAGNGFELATLTVSAIPEPASLAMMGLCAMSLMYLRRRR